MAIRKYLSRDHRVLVSDDLGVTWLTVSGLNSWSFGIDSNSEDTSTLDNGSWGSQMYTQRTGSVSLEGFRLLDAVTGTRDQGQLAIERASMKTGYDAYQTYQVVAITASGVNLGGFQFTGQPAITDLGGGVTDVDPFQAELVFEGRPTGSGIYNLF